MSAIQLAKQNAFETVKLTDSSGPKVIDYSLNIYNDELYVFGGSSSTAFNSGIHKFSFDTKCWFQVPVLGYCPIPRAGHSAVVKFDDLVVFGGLGPENQTLNDLCLFSFETHTWRILLPESHKQPEPRRNHVAVLDGSKMFIHGGIHDRKILSDTWVFDFDTCTWTLIDCKPAPPPRSNHSAVVRGDSMIIYAGLGTEPLSDIWSFNFETYQWTEVDAAKPSNPRHSHSAVFCWGKMFVFGGTVNEKPSNELIIYSFHLNSWQDASKSSGTIARTGHRAVLNKGQMIVYGGLEEKGRHFSEILLYWAVPPSTLLSSIARKPPAIFDCLLFNDTTSVPVSSALLSTRFPSLLPFASSSRQPPEKTAFVPVKPLPLSSRALAALCEFVNSGELNIESLKMEEVLSLLTLSHNCGNGEMKKKCEEWLLDVDLTGLRNLGEVIVACETFGLIQLERKCLRYFFILLPHSLTILPNLPPATLLHFTLLFASLAKSATTEDTPETEVITKMLQEIQLLVGL
ncbi:putative Actin-fragmin kinase [Blattamonas nauphoetae]|uniref:Actin-fragmin kinase n=1 Tax=Blattamonas nauphoetae TaxID=2049346 RepID=A0ABQ9XRI1_9EUKA|nr:putative Actin-fragmin kinase [Blattamonas nauphoetae]